MQGMTSKKPAIKKPMWEVSSQEEIEKGREEFKQRIKTNFGIAMKLKNNSEKFTPKPNSPPTLPTMQNFLYLAHLHKLDHSETLELFQYIIESLIELDQKLSEKLQYLEDNIQRIGEKSGTELKGMKSNMAVVQKNAIAVYNMMKEKQKQEQENEQKWRNVEGAKGYVV